MNCAVIVCGGRGTRMGAGSVSKTLLKVGGVPSAVRCAPSLVMRQKWGVMDSRSRIRSAEVNIISNRSSRCSTGAKPGRTGVMSLGWCSSSG